MPQNLNPFDEKSPIGKMEVTTASGLPQFKANVAISYVAADKEITITPTGLSANAATVYKIVVNSSNGVAKHIKVNVASPAAVTQDLSAITDFDLTKPFTFVFLAYKQDVSIPLSFGGEINPAVDFSKAYNNA